jgi:uncharacterized protein (DUF2235 family)
MAKRLILCCDGTWNSPDQVRGGKPCPTNVAKLEHLVPRTGSDNVEQRLHYQEGVGTGRWERLRGGVFGYGLSRNVLEAYRFIVANFEPGDQLFFFGFSRGAFTARSTAGLVRNSGVLRRENIDRAEQAYQLYRSKAKADHPGGREAELFRRSYSHETRIRFIGVWDTVGALGIPASGVPLLSAVNSRWAFHDTQLSSHVDAAFHALAIDEKRRTFEPTLWTTQPQTDEQRVEQVWLAGSHGNVGGGARDSALSDHALLWMMDRARSCGLTVTEPAHAGGGGSGRPTVQPDPMGPVSDSRTLVFRLWPPFHRPMGKKDKPHEYAAKSAVTRRNNGYAPPGLVAYLKRPDHQIMDDV